jgi:hypothetical protein
MNKVLPRKEDKPPSGTRIQNAIDYPVRPDNGGDVWNTVYYISTQIRHRGLIPVLDIRTQ